MLKWIQYDYEKDIVTMGFAAPVLALQKFRPPPYPRPSPSLSLCLFFCLTVTWYNPKHCLKFIACPDPFPLTQVNVLSPFTYKLNAVHSVLLFCHLSLTLLQLVHFKSMLLCHHSLTTHPSQRCFVTIHCYILKLFSPKKAKAECAYTL